MQKKPTVFKIEKIDECYFRKYGYIVVELLKSDEISFFKKISENIFKEFSEKKVLNNSGNLRVGLFDKITEFKRFHLLTYHQSILKTIEQLLGKDLILENAVLLFATPGNHYKQGWHRDVWQIPENKIDNRLFSRNYRHNCIQVNLAFMEDSCFWAVPGSHLRPDTVEEQHLFSGSKHLSPVDVIIPNNLCIKIEPGQAIFYNNNIIHRGYNMSKKQRATFHASYHSSRFKPTWHFYNPGFGTLTNDQVSKLSPKLIKMWKQNQAIKAHYPHIEKSWQFEG